MIDVHTQLSLMSEISLIGNHDKLLLSQELCKIFIFQMNFYDMCAEESVSVCL